MRSVIPLVLMMCIILPLSSSPGFSDASSPPERELLELPGLFRLALPEVNPADLRRARPTRPETPTPEPEPPAADPQPPAQGQKPGQAIPKPAPRPRPNPVPTEREPEPRPEPPAKKPSPTPPLPEPPPPEPIPEPSELVGQNIQVLTPTQLWQEPGISPILRYPYQGHVAQVLAQQGEYVKIAFGSKKGWVKLEDVQVTTQGPDYIRLGWQWRHPSDLAWTQAPPNSLGYNVYAPVNLLVQKAGVSRINFSPNITRAREQGYQVWVTAQQFGRDPRLDQDLAAQIVAHALDLDADGIVINFEDMGASARDGFTAFMTELFNLAKPYRLTVAVTVTRPASSPGSLCFDRPALAQVSDYLVLMAYDEHYATSPQGGSVASLPWTEASIQAVLSQGVPREKLLLGIPFYTRNWRLDELAFFEEDTVVVTGIRVNLREAPTTQSELLYQAKNHESFKYLATVTGQSVEGNTNWYMLEYQGQAAYVSATLARVVAGGNSYYKVSSIALPLQSFLDIQANLNPETRTSHFYTLVGHRREMTEVEISFDAATGQILVTYLNGDGVLCKIWVEDENSLRQRRRLMEQYQLPGLAAWSLEWMDLNLNAWNWLLN